jgi:importin subunit alpha-1
VLTGNEKHVEAVLDDVLLPFSQLIHHPRVSIRKETCWALSNITAGPVTHILRLLDVGLIDSVIDTLSQASLVVTKEVRSIVPI